MVAYPCAVILSLGLANLDMACICVRSFLQIGSGQVKVLNCHTPRISSCSEILACILFGLSTCHMMDLFHHSSSSSIVCSVLHSVVCLLVTISAHPRELHVRILLQRQICIKDMHGLLYGSFRLLFWIQKKI